MVIEASSRIESGRSGVLEPPVPGASNAIVWRAPSERRNGVHISTLAPRPLINRSGRPSRPLTE
jgi:hypothetical protein